MTQQTMGDQPSTEPRAEASQAAGSVSIRAHVGRKVSLAQQQNDFPLLHELVVANHGDQTLGDLSLEISADPAFLENRKWVLDRLEPGREHRVGDLNLALSRSYLAGLSESVRASVSIRASVGGRELGSWREPVLVLPPEEWGGLSHLPDLTAAFCRPNDPAVAKVQKLAAQALAASRLGGALDGYQSKDRGQVWRQVAALYWSMCSLDLDYAAPPASFEQEGQRIRSPRRVLEEKLATCLDLALFMAACLEQSGLNPLLVLTRGHALVGCWLVESDFSATLIDDCQSLRKRRQLGEMLLLETTAVTQRPAPSFGNALELGNRRLRDDQDFECALDIKRARMNLIRPLSDQEAPQPDEPAATDGQAAPPLLEEAPDLPPLDYLPEDREPAPDTPDGRVEQWKRKLLDLTLRNRLLNFKPGKKFLPIYCPDPAGLEDKLALGARLKFLPLPEIMEGGDPRDRDLHLARHGTDPKREFALRALAGNEIMVELSDKEMDARLVGLYRLARREMEEGGANTLFLALGFLKWTQKDNSGRVFRAPLLLLPVQLERASVAAGFKLTLHDDEPRLNPTLLEMLRKDYNLTMPALENGLLQDEAGLDVEGIWQTVRRGVRDVKGWEVSREVWLGTFSFTKFLMWKDLQDRLDQLKQNPVVKHLVESPRESYRGEGEFPDCRKLDDQYPPQEVFCPLSADSSQLTAVLAAARGKDFVVVGPPGTGKSQTIANMIVQCLAEGKTVLFVSEKMAALDVVYRRLRDVGVGPYCLEMHSAKARKLDVLKQLEAAWNSREAFDDAPWLDNTGQVARLRDRLNQLPRRLHKRYPNDFTPYQALGRLIANQEQPKLPLAWEGPLVHDREAMRRLREVAGRLGVNARAVGNLARHPLRSIGQEEWSPGWQQELLEKAGQSRDALKALQESLREFLASLGLAPEPGQAERVKACCDLAELLPRAAGKDWAFAFAPQASEAARRMERIAKSGREMEGLRSRLSLEYGQGITSLDLEELNSAWQQAEKAWWPKSFFRRKALAKALAAHAPAQARPRRADIPGDLARLIEIKALEQDIETLAEAGRMVGAAWRGLQTEWFELEAAAGFAGDAGAILGRLCGVDLEQRARTRQVLARLLAEGNDLLAPGGKLREQAERASLAWDGLGNSLAAVCRRAGLSGPEGLADPASPAWLQALEAALTGWRENPAKLKAWCGWRKVRRQAMQLGLAPLVLALERGELGAGEVEKAFEVNYCHWWLGRVVDDDEVLRSFNSAEHERSIGRFGELDEKVLCLAPKVARARISGAIPSQGAVGAQGNTEWGVLKRELTKKKRHMPLRKLVASLPNALTRLTPCLLMSPLSVAQYLSPDSAPFDLVIFDEASQIPVWDAIGALARGRQAVVVGDPKQLPPTNFFNRGDDDDDELQEWEVEDLESILDECQGANLPNLYLRWHYRSRHESLIVFSNMQYYQGELITFPSATTEDKAVSYFHVPEGVYEKGKARVNRGEARAVVAAVLGWLKDPEFLRNGWSLGVVTFNQQQQMLIEDLLDEARRREPELERHFGNELVEPVFVKNLENVQGDERDIILFSITYGPDAAGRVSMNFGPLNKQGGERRLNVAVTRARRALQVFGVLKPEHIDLSRTKAEGVRDLKQFLEYAELGPRALARFAGPTHGDYESPFEEEVAEELRQRGWTVHPQVGVSDFRVDLGVVHPDLPGCYLAGVECDGATYHGSATARDRDRLRESVLRGLGWNLVRVWSSDWWVDRAGSAEKLDKRIRELLAQDIEERERKERERKAREEEEAALAESPGQAPDGQEQTPSEEAGPATLPEPPGTESDPPEPASPPGMVQPPSPDDLQQVYVLVDPLQALSSPGRKAALAPDDFYQPGQDNKIRAMLKAVVEREGPVAFQSVAERLARAHGLTRVGKRIEQRVRKLAQSGLVWSKENGREFLWPLGSDPAGYQGFRLNPAGQRPLRPAERICARELQNLAAYVRETDCPLDEQGLLKGMANRLGFQVLSGKLRQILQAALEPGD